MDYVEILDSGDWTIDAMIEEDGALNLTIYNRAEPEETYISNQHQSGGELLLRISTKTIGKKVFEREVEELIRKQDEERGLTQ